MAGAPKGGEPKDGEAGVDAALLAELGAELRTEAGLDPPAWLLESRVRKRAEEHAQAPGAYLTWAAGGGDDARRERAVLVEQLRVGETRFFRHQPQMALLSARVLPERLAAARAEGRRLRLWSAGCASGEEAYTLALLALQAGAGDADIVASDVSPAAVATATSGRFSAARRAELPTWALPWFEAEARALVAREALRARVRCVVHNLLDGALPASGCDVILCRNVLIYFGDDERAGVLARLAQALAPDGYLFVGYSESLRAHERLFDAESTPDGVLYRRAGVAKVAEARTPPPARERKPSLPPPAPPPPPAMPRAPAGDSSAALLMLTGDYHDEQVARLSEALRAVLESRHPIVDLDGATFLGDAAGRVLRRAQQAVPGLRFRARRPATLRFLARHQLAGVLGEGDA